MYAAVIALEPWAAFQICVACELAGSTFLFVDWCSSYLYLYATMLDVNVAMDMLLANLLDVDKAIMDRFVHRAPNCAKYFMFSSIQLLMKACGMPTCRADCIYQNCSYPIPGLGDSSLRFCLLCIQYK